MAAAAQLREKEGQVKAATRDRVQAEEDATHLRAALRQVYTKPEAAEREFRRAVEGQGSTTAERIMRQRPSAYGELRGRELAGYANRERAAALQAIPEAARAGGATVRSEATAELSGRAGAAAEARAAQLRNEIGRTDAELQRLGDRHELAQRAGRSVEALQPEERQQLAARGLSEVAERTVSEVRSAVNAAERAASKAARLVDGPGRDRGLER